MPRITADDLYEKEPGKKWVLRRKPRLWLMRDFWEFVVFNVGLITLIIFGPKLS